MNSKLLNKSRLVSANIVFKFHSIASSIMSDSMNICWPHLFFIMEKKKAMVGTQSREKAMFYQNTNAKS